MSIRFAWLIGVVVLVATGFLVACGTKFSPSSDGLMLVGSQGSNVIQSFSFDLGNGHVSEISKPPGTGQPSSIVLDPGGAYAYVLVDRNAIQALKVNSDGTLSAMGDPVAFNAANVTIQGSATTESVEVIPNTLATDSAGKYLFVANRATADSESRSVPGSVSVFAVSGGGLAEVTGSPFFTSSPAMTTSQTPADLAALASTPTVFPAQNAVCSTDQGTNPPTAEFLYVADSANNLVWEFGVDSSSGALGNPPGHSVVPSFAVRSVPSGVAVDPCNRFVYVANLDSNNISAFTICNGTSGQASSCPITQGGDGSLVAVTNSPFSMSGGAAGPGPLLVDPLGNSLYVLDTLSSQVSAFKISPVSGSLTPATPAVVATGAQPKSIAIRADDNWLFVANYGSASVSQFSITPATGALSALPVIDTDNSPWGVAVK